MRHRSAKITFDRKKASRDALMQSLCAQLILHEKITIPIARAKAVRSRVERLMTTSKKKDQLTARRQLLSRLPGHPKAVERLLTHVAPRIAARPGGYTRIVKMIPRQGDGAKMARIELV